MGFRPQVQGINLLSTRAEDFLDLEGENVLLKKIEEIQNNPTQVDIHELVGSLGSVFINQQHALRILKNDISSINKNMQSEFKTITEKLGDSPSLSTQLKEIQELITKNAANVNSRCDQIE